MTNLHILWLSGFISPSHFLLEYLRILPGSTSPLTTPVLNLRHVFLFLTSLCVFGHIHSDWSKDILYLHLWAVFQVTTEESQMDEKPEDGAYIKGLIMEGACWDRQNIGESLPKILVDSLPIINRKPGEMDKFWHENICMYVLFTKPVPAGGLIHILCILDDFRFLQPF